MGEGMGYQWVFYLAFNIELWTEREIKKSSRDSAFLLVFLNVFFMDIYYNPIAHIAN